jgi:hypothetical protein
MIIHKGMWLFRCSYIAPSFEFLLGGNVFSIAVNLVCYGTLGL